MVESFGKYFPPFTNVDKRDGRHKHTNHDHDDKKYRANDDIDSYGMTACAWLSSLRNCRDSLCIKATTITA